MSFFRTRIRRFGTRQNPAGAPCPYCGTPLVNTPRGLDCPTCSAPPPPAYVRRVGLAPSVTEADYEPNGACGGNGFKRFVAGYIEAALWTSTDESDESGGRHLDENYDASDIDEDSIEDITHECCELYKVNAADLAQARADDQNGHDFWPTRTHHGTGFWDRGLGAVGDRLDEASKAAGERALYVGDDGKIYYTEG